MKTIINKNIFFFFLLLLSVAQISYSQNYSEDEEDTNETTETSVTQSDGTVVEVSPDFFSTFFNTQANEKLNLVEGNSVFIRQIGESNIVAAGIQSNASDINIAQNGDLNNIQLQYNVDKVVTDLTQNGNSNLIKDYVIDPNAEVSLELQQNGDNLTFDKFGSNNITKNIKFTQTEASPTIIIRSFD